MVRKNTLTGDGHMKKICILMVLALALIMLAGCGKQNEQSETSAAVEANTEENTEKQAETETGIPEDVETEENTDEDKTADAETPTGLLADSIISYRTDSEACQKLISDMNEGRTPVSCFARYDQGGAGPEVTVTDPETIAEIYDQLSVVTVAEETNESVTDCYHCVVFTLEDESTVSFTFENDIWYYGSNPEMRFKVENTKGLWNLVKELYEAEME